MKLSLSWIKDFVNIPEDMDMKQLAYDLTMDTVEVEDVEYLADRFDHMVVGVIEDIEPHPNADKLRVCKVDIGDGEIKDIVCGGINLEKGMRVAVSCPGAIVCWHGEGEPVEIKKSKLRGVASYGMICASDEIGLGDHDLSQSSAFQSEYLLLHLQTLTESSHARLYSLSYPNPYAGLLPVESASLPNPLPAAFPCGIHQYKVNHRTDKF